MGWKEQCWEPWELEAVLVRAEGQLDTYLSESISWRSQGGGTGPEALWSIQRRGLLRRARTAGFVARGGSGEGAGAAEGGGLAGPSLALSSGQGLALIWRHAPMSRKRLAEWTAAQDRIYRVLKSVGADPKARDAAGVLRIAGTTHAKNGATVRSIIDAAERAYCFDDLVEALVKNPVREDEEERGKPGPTCAASRCSGPPAVCAATRGAGARRPCGRVG